MNVVRSTRVIGWLVVSLFIPLVSGCEDDSKDTEAPAGGSTAPVTAGGGAGKGSQYAAGSGGASGSGTRSQANNAACPVMVNDSDCDRSRRPLVFVHGTVANGESFAHPALLLASNGYCPDRIRAVEYHSLVAQPCSDGSQTCPFVLNRAETYRRAKAAIDEAIDQLLEETGADKVDLAGHSQGAGHGAAYTAESPDKIAHYIHLAGQQLEADPGGVPTLCLSSTGDAPRQCKTTKNVIFQDDTLDHAAVSSSTEAFVEIYKFLNDDQEPEHDSVQCGNSIVLEGRAPTFGDNSFLPGSKVEAYELGEEPDEDRAPVKTFEIGEDGNFGPWEAKRGVAYEFKLIPPPGDARRPRHVYMPAFTRSDRLLRFSFETEDAVASATGKKVNYDDNHAVIVARRRQKAFLVGRDSLTIDGFEAINEVNAAARRVVCALYLYDASQSDGPGPGDEKSSGGTLISSTFVNSADVFIPTEEPKFVEVKFNDTVLRVPNRPSKSQGMALVLVD